MNCQHTSTGGRAAQDQRRETLALRSTIGEEEHEAQAPTPATRLGELARSPESHKRRGTTCHERQHHHAHVHNENEIATTHAIPSLNETLNPLQQRAHLHDGVVVGCEYPCASGVPEVHLSTSVHGNPDTPIGVCVHWSLPHDPGPDGPSVVAADQQLRAPLLGPCCTSCGVNAPPLAAPCDHDVECGRLVPDASPAAGCRRLPCCEESGSHSIGLRLPGDLLRLVLQYVGMGLVVEHQWQVGEVESDGPTRLLAYRRLMTRLLVGHSVMYLRAVDRRLFEIVGELARLGHVHIIRRTMRGHPAPLEVMPEHLEFIHGAMPIRLLRRDSRYDGYRGVSPVTLDYGPHLLTTYLPLLEVVARGDPAMPAPGAAGTGRQAKGDGPPKSRGGSSAKGKRSVTVSQLQAFQDDLAAQRAQPVRVAHVRNVVHPDVEALYRFDCIARNVVMRAQYKNQVIDIARALLDRSGVPDWLRHATFYHMVRIGAPPIEPGTVGRFEVKLRRLEGKTVIALGTFTPSEQLEEPIDDQDSTDTGPPPSVPPTGQPPASPSVPPAGAIDIDIVGTIKTNWLQGQGRGVRYCFVRVQNHPDVRLDWTTDRSTWARDDTIAMVCECRNGKWRARLAKLVAKAAQSSPTSPVAGVTPVGAVQNSSSVAGSTGTKPPLSSAAVVPIGAPGTSVSTGTTTARQIGSGWSRPTQTNFVDAFPTLPANVLHAIATNWPTTVRQHNPLGWLPGARSIMPVTFIRYTVRTTAYDNMVVSATIPYPRRMDHTGMTLWFATHSRHAGRPTHRLPCPPRTRLHANTLHRWWCFDSHCVALRPAYAPSIESLRVTWTAADHIAILFRLAQLGEEKRTNAFRVAKQTLDSDRNEVVQRVKISTEEAEAFSALHVKWAARLEDFRAVCHREGTLADYSLFTRPPPVLTADPDYFAIGYNLVCEVLDEFSRVLGHLAALALQARDEYGLSPIMSGTVGVRSICRRHVVSVLCSNYLDRSRTFLTSGPVKSMVSDGRYAQAAETYLLQRAADVDVHLADVVENIPVRDVHGETWETVCPRLAREAFPKATESDLLDWASAAGGSALGMLPAYAMGPVVTLPPAAAAPPLPAAIPPPPPLAWTSPVVPIGYTSYEDINGRCAGLVLDLFVDYCRGLKLPAPTATWTIPPPLWQLVWFSQSPRGLLSQFLFRAGALPRAIIITDNGFSGIWPVEARDEIPLVDAIMHVTWNPGAVGHVALMLPSTYAPSPGFSRWNREVVDWLVEKLGWSRYSQGTKDLIGRRGYRVRSLAGRRTLIHNVDGVASVYEGHVGRWLRVDFYNAESQRHSRLCLTTTRVSTSSEAGLEFVVDDFTDAPPYGQPLHLGITAPNPYPNRRMGLCVCHRIAAFDDVLEISGNGAARVGPDAPNQLARHRIPSADPQAPLATNVMAPYTAYKVHGGCLPSTSTVLGAAMARLKDAATSQSIYARVLHLNGRYADPVYVYTKIARLPAHDRRFRGHVAGSQCACGRDCALGHTMCAKCVNRRRCPFCGQHRSSWGVCMTCPVVTATGGIKPANAVLFSLHESMRQVAQMDAVAKDILPARQSRHGALVREVPGAILAPLCAGVGQTGALPPPEYRVTIEALDRPYNVRRPAEGVGWLHPAFVPLVMQDSQEAFLYTLGSRMTTTVDVLFVHPWPQKLVEIAQAFASMLTTGPDGHFNNFRQRIPQFGTPGFRAVLWDCTAHMEPSKRQRYRHLYEHYLKEPCEINKKDYAARVFIKREIKGGFEETQHLAGTDPDTEAQGPVDPNVWRGPIDNLATARAISDLHTGVSSLIELVVIHSLTKFCHKVLSPTGPCPALRRILYLCGGNPVTIGGDVDSWISAYQFQCCQDADFSKFDSRQKYEAYIVESVIKGIIAPEAYADPVLADVLHTLGNPACKMSAVCRGPTSGGNFSVSGQKSRKTGPRPSIRVNGPMSILSGYMGTSWGGSMRNIVLNLAMMLCAAYGNAWVAGHRITPHVLEQALADTNFGVAVLGDDQLRMADDEGLLNRMNAHAPQFNQKCTGGRARPICEVARCTLLGSRMIRYEVNGRVQPVLDLDLAREFGRAGWVLNDSIHPIVIRFLVANMRLLLFEQKPWLGPLYEREVNLILAKHKPLIDHFLTRAGKNKRSAPDPDATVQEKLAHWLSRPDNVLLLQSAIDPDWRHKSWKTMPSGVKNIRATPETMADLAMAYFDGDLNAALRLDVLCREAASTVTSLPAYLMIPELDLALARAIGRRP